jgi:hypothetical protein
MLGRSRLPTEMDWCFRDLLFFLAEESSFLQAGFVGSITMEAL